MKTPLWVLLLMSLCVPSRGDCQGDCLTCALLLPPQQTFNTLVCLLECEAQAFPAHTWDLCYHAMALNPDAVPARDFSKRTEDEDKPLAIVKMEDEDGAEYSEALERFRHMAQGLNVHEPSEGPQTSDQFADSFELGLDSGEDEEERDRADKREEQDQDGDAALDLSKRFGGFMKGRHGFRKLVSSGRPLQKRYGGFIGIRKSARKWNNQKRVSQLLRQYLSLTARTGRSGHFANLSAAAVRQKNEV